MAEFLKIESSRLNAAISPYGAALARLWFEGHETSLVLGLDRPEDYADAPSAIGVVIAPIAGRIAGAKAPLAGRILNLEPNTPPDTLHSGSDAAQHKKWDVISHQKDAITLRCEMADGLCGLPGQRRFDVTYSVDGSALNIDMESSSDADTFVNVTSHAYWILDDSGGLQDHVLSLPTTKMVEANSALIPSGRIVDVSGGEWDFSKGGNPVGGADLDACYCLGGSLNGSQRRVLSLRSNSSGINLDVTSTEPGVVLYTGSGLPKLRAPPKTPQIEPYSGLAIEAQKWPDAPNHLNFPTIVLSRNRVARQKTRFVLSRPQR